ncbi:altronate dehydratase, partial [Rhizobium sp. CRIBSB]|nr:altronate dehydratase [Rhizobium sp. CRIBSB]
MNRIVTLDPADDVSVVLDALEPGAIVESLNLRATDTIPVGHKIARHPVKAGAVVRKFGQVIGEALHDIPAGGHVHTHNLAMSDVRMDGLIGTDAHAIPKRSGATFDGYV